MTTSKNIYDKVDEVYEDLFDYTCDTVGDTIYEICVEIKLTDGTTIRKSWRDREHFVAEPTPIPGTSASLMLLNGK